MFGRREDLTSSYEWDLMPVYNFLEKVSKYQGTRCWSSKRSSVWPLERGRGEISDTFCHGDVSDLLARTWRWISARSPSLPEIPNGTPGVFESVEISATWLAKRDCCATWPSKQPSPRNPQTVRTKPGLKTLLRWLLSYEI